jgi:hypothetical protein
MVLSVDIGSQTEARLRQKAEAAGKDIRAFVADLLDQAAAKASLEEVLAPLRRQFAASGISDEELIDDITRSQSEYRAIKRAG